MCLSSVAVPGLLSPSHERLYREQLSYLTATGAVHWAGLGSAPRHRLGCLCSQTALGSRSGCFSAPSWVTPAAYPLGVHAQPLHDTGRLPDKGGFTDLTSCLAPKLSLRLNDSTSCTPQMCAVQPDGDLWSQCWSGFRTASTTGETAGYRSHRVN